MTPGLAMGAIIRMEKRRPVFQLLERFAKVRRHLVVDDFDVADSTKVGPCPR
jgi:hypothetical protein